jgi:hypothetical protein
MSAALSSDSDYGPEDFSEDDLSHLEKLRASLGDRWVTVSPLHHLVLCCFPACRLPPLTHSVCHAGSIR